MVETIYRIPSSISEQAYNDIMSQPNLVKMHVSPHSLELTFDHTEEESTAFKQMLSTKLLVYGTDLTQYTSSFVSPMLNGIRGNSVEVSTNYTVIDTDWRIRMNAAAGTRTVTIPTAVGRGGKIFVIRKVDTTFNIVSVVPSLLETIGGFSSWELRNPNDLVEIFSDGTTWHIIDYSNYDYNGYRRIGTTAPNRYYIAGMDAQGALGALTAVTANTLYALPIMIGRGGTIDSVGVNVSTTVNSSNVRMGIYRNLNGIPGTLISDLGTVGTSNPAGFKEITGLSIRLQPGLHWLTAVFSHAPTLRTVSQTSMMGVFGVDNAATTAVGTGYTSAFTYAALPATFPAVTVSTAATQPALFYHFSA